MANITRVKIQDFALPTAFSFVAGSTSGDLYDYKGEDTKTVVLFNNTAAAKGTATIKAGDGIQGVKDIVVDVPAGYSAMVIESGYFKLTSGTNKGKIQIVPSAATITVACVELV